MEQEMKPDLIINGISSAGGGEYGNVKIDGIGTVEGNVKSTTIDTNGITKIRGDLIANELDSDGIMRIQGHLYVGHSIIDGDLNVGGSVRAEKFTVNGNANISGDCEVEDLTLEGAFNVNGFLNAGKMNVKLQGRGKAREIGVESIQVRQISRSAWSKLWQWMLPKFTPELHAVSIEGDDIDLEYTEAKVVRGGRVVIGKGCNIERVEYRGVLKVHPGAKIGEEVKMGD